MLHNLAIGYPHKVSFAMYEVLALYMLLWPSNIRIMVRFYGTEHDLRQPMGTSGLPLSDMKHKRHDDKPQG